VKYDLDTKTSEIHNFGKGRTPGEAVFVPASSGAAEDEGYLLTYVYDADRDTSDFVILDAQNITSEPLAAVPLPQRVPMGFHGNWIPDPS
jgi:carotenoid cleavage dioxygenase